MGEESGKTEELRPAVAWERQHRKELKEQWDAWFRLRRLEAEGTMYHWLRVRLQEAFDKPVTWFKETIVDPLHDKYKPAFYHRSFSRVPDIDQCKVLDNACIKEATTQFKLDRQVDGQILTILMERLHDCMDHNDYTKGKNYGPCIPLMEEYEEAELNFFIKYGELGDYSTPIDVLMKQKHRMIWERRNPEVMAEREKAFKEHKRQIALGKADSAFWKKGYPWDDKEGHWFPYNQGHELEVNRDQPVSKDPLFYKDVQKEGTEAYEWEKNRTRIDRFDM